MIYPDKNFSKFYEAEEFLRSIDFDLFKLKEYSFFNISDTIKTVDYHVANLNLIILRLYVQENINSNAANYILHKMYFQFFCSKLALFYL